MPWVGAIASVMMLAGAALMPATAQDAGDERRLAAYVFAGTCDTVASQPVAELGALERDADAARAMAEAAGVDPESAWGVEGHVAPALDDLRASEHVVAIREDRGDATPIVACGPIEGDGAAVDVALKAFGDTGLAGLARIETIQRVRATTRVAVGVWEAPEPAGDERQMPEAPDFALTLFDGETVRLSDYRGKTLVLVMWASWCPYCNEEFPMYEEMWQEMRDEDVVFLGIGLKNDDQGEAEAFIEEHGATFPVGRDTEGGNQIQGEIEATLGVPATPALFIITPDGRVYGATYGVIERGSFEDAIRDAARYRDEG
jgi:peroxiredoxin